MKKFTLGFMLVALLTIGTTNTQAGIIIGSRTDDSATANGIIIGSKTEEVSTDDSTDFFSYIQAMLAGIIIGS